jgi:hypothetical protein
VKLVSQKPKTMGLGPVRTVLLHNTSSLSPEMTQTLSWLFYNIQGNTVENAVRKDQHRVFCDKETVWHLYDGHWDTCSTNLQTNI